MNGLHTMIEKKAYQYFVERGMCHGKDVEDWLKAEKEILDENNGKRKPGKDKKIR